MKASFSHGRLPWRVTPICTPSKRCPDCLRFTHDKNGGWIAHAYRVGNYSAMWRATVITASMNTLICQEPYPRL